MLYCIQAACVSEVVEMACEALKILFKDEIEAARKEGYKEGREEARKLLAMEMISEGMPDDEVLKYAKISVEVLNALKKDVKG